MIDGKTDVFPNNAVILMGDALKAIDEDVPVHRRRLTSLDEVQCIGIFAQQWMPRDDSYEMQGTQGMPTVQIYEISLMCLVKDMDEEVGMMAHAELTKLAHKTIMRDSILRDSLRALRTDLYGERERLLNWRIETARYLSEEVGREFIYLSTSTVRLETETSRGI